MTDVVVIGGGITALSPRPISPRPASRSRCSSGAAQVGGAAATEEFHPGFRNSVAAYTVSLLNPKVIRDLDLAAHGLRIVERPLSNFLPLPDGRYLKSGPGRTESRGRKILRPRRRAARVLRGAARAPGRRLARARARDAAEPRDRTWARRQSRRPRRYRQGRKSPAFARARRAARSRRALHPLGRRRPRPVVRERSDQGDPRLRRDRRDLRQPLCAPERPTCFCIIAGAR